jgi:DNA-binding MarR family transcriptional regulator
VDFMQMLTGLERFVRVLRGLTNPGGLSLTAASTLFRLDEIGAHRLSDLAVAEGVTQPGMTQLISRLEREGLAARKSDPTDGRVVMVEITVAGRERRRARRGARAEKLSELLGDLSAEDRAAILKSLQIADRLAERSQHR